MNYKTIRLAKASREHLVQPAGFLGGLYLNHLRERKSKLHVSADPEDQFPSHLPWCDENTHHHSDERFENNSGCSKEIKQQEKQETEKTLGAFAGLESSLPKPHL